MTRFFSFKLIAEIWDLHKSLMAEEWAEILTDSWEIAENYSWDSNTHIQTLSLMAKASSFHGFAMAQEELQTTYPVQ